MIKQYHNIHNTQNVKNTQNVYNVSGIWYRMSLKIIRACVVLIVLVSCHRYQYSIDNTIPVDNDNSPVENFFHPNLYIPLEKRLVAGVPLFIAPGYSCLMLARDELIAFDWQNGSPPDHPNSCRDAEYIRFFLAEENNITIKLTIGNSSYSSQRPQHAINYRNLMIGMYKTAPLSCSAVLNFLPTNYKENLLYADYSVVTVTIVPTAQIGLHSCAYATDVMEFLIDHHLG